MASWRIFCRNHECFEVITCYVIMTNFWGDKLFDVRINVYITFDVMANGSFWWHDNFLMPWQTFWCHDELFNVMVCALHHDELCFVIFIFNVMTSFYRLDIFFIIPGTKYWWKYMKTCFWHHAMFLTSWHLLTSWRVFFMSWRTFASNDEPFVIMPCFWNHCKFCLPNLTSWHVFDFMINFFDIFLTSWQTFWRHGVFLMPWRVFDFMMCFWLHDKLFDIMTNVFTP